MKKETMINDDEMEKISGGALIDGWDKKLILFAYNCKSNKRSFDDFKESFDKGNYTRYITDNGQFSEEDKIKLDALMEDIKKMWK